MGGRGGGMGGGRGGGGMGRTVEAPPNPSAKDVEKQDPVQLLLDKHKKLKLDKDQITALHTLDATLRSQNAPYYHRVDSLHDAFKPPSGGFTRSTGSDGGRASMARLGRTQLLDKDAVKLNHRGHRGHGECPR